MDDSLPRHRVQLGYLAGMFGKQVLPLGNVGGSAIMAYVLAEDLDRRFRDVFAAVTASELLVFAGSIGAATVGLVTIVVGPYGGLPGWVALALLLAAVLALVGGGAVVAYRRHVVASLVERTAALVRATVGRVSVRVKRSLAPERVRGGTATFLEAFGAATDDTSRVVVGWVAFSMPLGLALFLTPASGVVTGTPPEVAAAGVIVYRLASYWLVVSVGGLASLHLSAMVWHALD